MEDESGNRSVDFTYAKKFARMAGHQYYFPEEVKPQLFSAVKAVAKAYLQGEITSEEMPSLNELMVILSRDRLRNILGSKGTQLREDIIAGHPFLSKTSALYQLNGADFSPYFAAMPYYSKRKEENVASSALTPPQAFELAANTATGLGNFLKIYRESIGKSLEDVGKAILVTKEAIRQIEGKISIAWETVDKILSAKNPYDLPTDVERNIQIDVAAFIREIHIPSRSWGRISKKEQQMIDQKAADEGKWLTFVDVARELFDTEAYLINDSTYKRNGLHTKIHFNPEYIILRAVWDEVIVAHAKSIQPWQEDVLKIGGAEVRYKRGTDSEYRLHADGLQALRTAMLLTRDSIRK